MTGLAVTPVQVMIVDDDPDQRHVLRRLLSRAGIDDVIEAAGGDEALLAAETSRPDLVILDLLMPGRSGVDVLPELHNRLPDARVVVLSNLPRWRMGEVVRHRGAAGYVEKRVPPDKLVREILLAAALTEGAAARVSTHFPSAAASVSRARRFVRAALEAPAEEFVAEVELLVSELVTNAVLHTSSQPRVDVILRHDHVRVEVYDDEPALPEPRLPDSESLGGRGMLLLGQIASRWGADRSGEGKIVWFELDRAVVSA